MKSTLRITKDGSHSLFVEALNEHYHSIHGAVQESKHVFLKMGMDATTASPLRILEIGFGTGLNAYLTYRAALDDNRRVEYTGVEKYPVEESIWTQLNYPDPDDALSVEQFREIHLAKWGTEEALHPLFSITKIRQDFLDPLPEGPFDLIYFDAFAPEKQPDLWTVEQFQELYRRAAMGCVMVTYSAKGQVRRNMIEAGWEVEKVAGPPGKREMLRAKKV